MQCSSAGGGGARAHAAKRSSRAVCVPCRVPLQLKPGASAAEVRRAYRSLAMAYHPDKCKLQRAAEAFQKIKEACNGLLQRAGLA